MRWSWDLWDEPWDELWDEHCSLSHLLLQLSAQGQVIALQDDELLCQLLPAALQGPQPLLKGISLPCDPGTAQLQLLHPALQGQYLHRGAAGLDMAQARSNNREVISQELLGIWGAGGGIQLQVEPGEDAKQSRGGCVRSCRAA